MLTSRPRAMLTASPTSASVSPAAISPRTVSVTKVKSRVWLPSPKISGGCPFSARTAIRGITSPAAPAWCSRKP
jgi:hypothetical protein